MKTNREVVRAVVQPSERSNKTLLLRTTVLFVLCLAINLLSSSCFAQDDFYPIPQRQGNFGFPYPAASADEPGVTFNRRYLLDGEPALRFNPRPQDEIWLVSSREIQSEHTDCADAHRRLVCKHPIGTAWNQVPIDQLLDVRRRNAQMPTVIFIHGNRTPAFWSRRRGKHAYQSLVGPRRDLPAALTLPIELPATRFIIWSWPSDPIDGPFNDFAAKSERTRTDGKLLGRLLNDLAPGPLVIVAYSLGTQIALDGIESLASSQTGSGCNRSVRLISMAPVTRCDWPDCPEQIPLVTSGIRELTLFQNKKDIALKAFDIYCRLNGQTSCTDSIKDLANQHAATNRIDVAQQVGREHNILSYITIPEVRCKLAESIAVENSAYEFLAHEK